MRAGELSIGRYAEYLGITRREAMRHAEEGDDGALDPLYLFAVRKVMADETLGGLAVSIDWTGASVVFRPEGSNIIGLELGFDVKFAVQSGDPAAKG